MKSEILLRYFRAELAWAKALKDADDAAWKGQMLKAKKAYKNYQDQLETEMQEAFVSMITDEEVTELLADLDLKVA